MREAMTSVRVERVTTAQLEARLARLEHAKQLLVSLPDEQSLDDEIRRVRWLLGEDAS